jgi:hypothetical protein
LNKRNGVKAMVQKKWGERNKAKERNREWMKWGVEEMRGKNGVKKLRNGVKKKSAKRSINITFNRVN